VIEAAILFQWSPKVIEAENRPVGFSREETSGNHRTRREVLSFVKSQMEKDIAGNSWSQFHKDWFNNEKRFLKTVDNGIKRLRHAGILTNVVGMDIPQNIRLVEEMNSLIESAIQESPKTTKKDNSCYR